MSAADSSAIVISVSGEEREVTANCPLSCSLTTRRSLWHAAERRACWTLPRAVLLATPLSRFSFTNRTA